MHACPVEVVFRVDLLDVSLSRCILNIRDLGSSPEEKLALRVFGSKCWKTQPVGTQEVVFDGLCFGCSGVRTSKDDPPWGSHSHANHQGIVPVCWPD